MLCFSWRRQRDLNSRAGNSRPTPLAGAPLRPNLGMSPNKKYALVAERVGFEPTVRYKRTPIFKTGAINQLDHLSMSHDITNITILSCRLSIVLIKNFKKLIFFLYLQDLIILINLKFFLNPNFHYIQ